MNEGFKTWVSKYASYLLRHNPENLKMDREGFVQIEDLLFKIKARFPMVDRKVLMSIVSGSGKRRFEVVDDQIRALYGHSIDMELNYREDLEVSFLFHGTSPEAAREILRRGLKPMGRRWVHLSPTKEIAFEVGKRKARAPTILTVDVYEARRDGIKFYKAMDKIYLCKHVPARYIKAGDVI